jgi:toxin HigB-1
VAHCNRLNDTEHSHKGLKRLFEHDDPSGVNPEHADSGMFSRPSTPPLNVTHMDLPGFRLHQLKGVMKGFWAVTVRFQLAVIFRFDRDAEDVDYVDTIEGREL